MNGLIAAMETLRGVNPFRISFDRKKTFEEDIGYLKVIDGQYIVSDLFNHLNGLLGIKSLRPYLPHLTIVRGNNCKIKSVSFDTSNYIINEVVLERIETDDSSTVEYTIQMLQED